MFRPGHGGRKFLAGPARGSETGQRSGWIGPLLRQSLQRQHRRRLNLRRRRVDLSSRTVDLQTYGSRDATTGCPPNGQEGPAVSCVRCDPLFSVLAVGTAARTPPPPGTATDQAPQAAIRSPRRLWRS
jgi:hypothetical protein